MLLMAVMALLFGGSGDGGGMMAGVMIAAADGGPGGAGAQDPPPEDDRVIGMVVEQIYKEKGWDPNFTDGDHQSLIYSQAVARATTMPAAQKQKLIEQHDAIEADEELRGLIGREVWDNEPGPRQAISGQAVEEKTRVKFESLSPQQRKTELQRLRDKYKKSLDAEEREDGEEPDDAGTGDGLESGGTPANTGDGLE